MAEILVTGGTGNLGRPTVARLRARGHIVRILTRGEGTPADGGHPGEGQPAGVAESAEADGSRAADTHPDRAHPDRTHPERTHPDRTFSDRAHLARGHLVHGDLVSGHGVAAAVDGVDTVIHLATTNGKRDVAATQHLIAACEKAAVRHLIVISIVGVDEIPLGYYRAKLQIESLVGQSTVPHTIVRVTQFHSFVARLFAFQRWSPVVFAPTFSFQPISVDDVAVRLTELAEGDAAGRVSDIGGPEQRTARNLARAWAKAASIKRPIWPLTLPGATFAGYATGHNLVPGPPYGTTTFENYLATRYDGTSH
ncbi:uncharacterized protein YbjT (DUF2867 family) [Glaciihabitans tibetensis]|uniref:Uncharacterized protein YbjT (DUF2867 family) n=1 Tax=Glaciihabitans tibetensis TaxID=1266600 RepID=A0A2T0VDQ7_9MICO|nr:NAD(P)H-binding protein [Glaciihabitans tibetensis]PRY68318.1 uncharacterized protein YbjT (DUF2867 family) [Glaciihabitans tibetensis]